MPEATIHLEDDLGRLLGEVARRQGRSQAEVILEALERYLSDMAQQEQPRRFVSVGAGKDSQLRGAEVHDLIERTWKAR
jgi:predicted transcriptional regulator